MDKLTEKTMLTLLRLAGIPTPTSEHRFHPTRKWRFDYAWPDLRVALEIEGGIWTGGRHTSGAGYQKDMEKYNQAAILGWCLLRITPEQARSRAVAELVSAAFESRKGQTK